MSAPKWARGPWRRCGAARGGCSCGTVWSIPADAPVATVIIGEWGDDIAVKRKVGRKWEPTIETIVYGKIGEEVGKANAALISAAPEMADALALIDEFAWSSIGADCEEAREELMRRITACREALAKARGERL